MCDTLYTIHKSPQHTKKKKAIKQKETFTVLNCIWKTKTGEGVINVVRTNQILKNTLQSQLSYQTQGKGIDKGLGATAAD